MLSPQFPASRFPDFDYKCCGKSDVLTKTVFELFEKKYIFVHRRTSVASKAVSPIGRVSGVPPMRASCGTIPVDLMLRADMPSGTASENWLMANPGRVVTKTLWPTTRLIVLRPRQHVAKLCAQASASTSAAGGYRPFLERGEVIFAKGRILRGRPFAVNMG